MRLKKKKKKKKKGEKSPIKDSSRVFDACGNGLKKIKFELKNWCFLFEKMSAILEIFNFSEF